MWGFADSSKSIQAAHGSRRHCFVPPLLLQLLPVWDVMPDHILLYISVFFPIRWQCYFPNKLCNMFIVQMGYKA